MIYRLSVACMGATLAACLLVLTPSPPARAESPTCFGEPATIVGAADSDQIEGTGGQDVIVAHDGNDRISGGGGDDLICGGGGNDSVDGGTGDDKIDGGDGRDNLSGGGGDDAIFGGDRSDTLSGDEGNDRLLGEVGDDALYGNDGADQLDGGPDDDYADGGNGDDNVGGDTGDDRLYGEAGVDALSGDEGSDVLTGGTGNDRVAGGPDDDVMYESFVRPTDEDPDVDDGNDDYDGGPGKDLVSYEASATAVNASLTTGTASGNGNDTFAAVEGLIGSDLADRLIGSDRNDTLSGRSGDDTLDARDGNDVLLGGEDDDALDGGAGTDEANFRDARKRLVVNLVGRASTGQGDDSLLDIEDVYGGYRNDFIIGDDGPNQLDGGISGEDTLRGLGGNDHLIGGRYDLDRKGLPIYIDDDTLLGGPGDDVLDGAFGTDNADFATSSTGVNADLGSGTATGEGTDELISIEDLAGSGYDDVLVGDESSNELVGRSGNDRLAGLGSDDVLVGGTGDDSYEGGDGSDTLDFGRSRTGVDADLSAGTITGEGNDTVADVENILGSTRPDTLTGNDSINILSGRTNDDSINGGGGDDVLIGLKGDDTIDGGDGEDMIYDGDGNDHVAGGAGNDYFRSGTGDDSYDGSSDMDTLDYSSSERGITADLSTGTTSTFGDQGSDTLVSIENLIGTIETDQFTGDAADNYFVGNGHVDELYGEDGNDIMEPLGGADIVDGGDGIDGVIYAAAPRPVTADLASGFANGHGADTLLSIESLLGSRWPDIFRGSDDDNIFIGADGGDILEGMGGDDYLDGGAAFDTADGGDGADDCVQVESLLDCEGSAPAAEGSDAAVFQSRFATFEALRAKWAQTEQALQGRDGFVF